MFLAQIIFAQNVILNKVTKTHTNDDKGLYKINPDSVSAEYLCLLYTSRCV